MGPDDRELLEAWKQGDQDAARTLVERYYEPLARFFRHKVGEDCPDLIHRTLLACVESRDRFRGEASVRTYLFTIARNELFAYFRARHRSAEVDFGTLSVADLRTGPSTALGRRQEQRLLLEALRRISIDAQITLELYYWESMKTREIARVLGIPHGTARSRLRLARDALEAELAALSRSREGLASTTQGMEGQGIEDWIRSMQARVPREP